MSEPCCGKVEAGRDVCELTNEGFERVTVDVKSCPECSSPGKPVNTITVKALISKSLRSVTSNDYRFCKEVDCSAVYFSIESGSRFTTEDLRAPVYQKVPDQPETDVCYCFKHSVGDISNAGSKQRNKILEDINEGIKLGQCACDIRNPQGSCCLGNVRGLIRQLSEDIKLPV